MNEVCADRCGDDLAYWAAQFADPKASYRRRVEERATRKAREGRRVKWRKPIPAPTASAAAVGSVHCPDVLALVLAQPDLTTDNLARIALRVVQPPGIYTSSRIGVGFLVPGDHDAAITVLEQHSTLAAVTVALARTWTRPVADLATAAEAIAAQGATQGAAEGAAEVGRCL